MTFIGNEAFTNDERVVKLRPYLNRWGVNSDGVLYDTNEPLSFEPCTSLDLGISVQQEEAHNRQHKFFDPQNTSKEKLHELAKNLQCLDTS